MESPLAGGRGRRLVRVPDEYKGREQSLLKHRVLEEYLVAWGHKLGSVAQRRRVRLCYVDGFAGPWNAQSKTLQDTSIAIGLRALETAADTWSKRGAKIEVKAAFVEKEAAPFRELEGYLREHRGGVQTHALHGEFGAMVPKLQAWLRADAALIFVDPTGWKGAAMRFIAPLVGGQPRRDVLVNVMFDHINRFKDDPRAFLREQMREFFGLGEVELPEALAENELFTLYRRKLKETCGLDYAADLAIPHPTDDRTKFRLVVGGTSPTVLELFRDIEKKVIGAEAAAIRDDAATRRVESRTGQLTLVAAPPPTDTHYESLHAQGLREAQTDLVAHLAQSGPTAFGDLWPPILEARHITRTELAQLAWNLTKAGEIAISNAKPRDRTVHDGHILSAGHR
jgi:three-Cys-motif partner protein